MLYKKLQTINLPWTYEELMLLPIFMKEEIYANMDEFIEQENKSMQQMQR
jgi:hypothetical protein